MTRTTQYSSGSCGLSSSTRIGWSGSAGSFTNPNSPRNIGRYVVGWYGSPGLIPGTPTPANEYTSSVVWTTRYSFTVVLAAVAASGVLSRIRCWA